MITEARINFTLDRDIGYEGRNSRVFIAHDHQLDCSVVVKQIDRATFTDETEYFSEAKRLYYSRHPHVVEVKYACITDDHVYLAMPLYPGGSVHRLLHDGQLRNRQIVQYGLEFLSGLHHVHARGLIHFDVKPSNVLIDASGRAALSDFGLARFVDMAGLAEQDTMYQMHQSPEAIQTTTLSSATDIYQAGLTLYRMATGVGELERQWNEHASPMDAFKAVLAGELPDRNRLPAHRSNRLKRVIQKSLEVEPDNRYRTALDLINDLGAVDDWLDWDYEVNPSSSMERWRLVTSTHVKNVSLEPVSKSEFKIGAETIRIDTGAVRRSKQHSGTAKTLAQAQRMVRTALTGL